MEKVEILFSLFFLDRSPSVNFSSSRRNFEGVSLVRIVSNTTLCSKKLQPSHELICHRSLLSATAILPPKDLMILYLIQQGF